MTGFSFVGFSPVFMIIIEHAKNRCHIMALAKKLEIVVGVAHVTGEVALLHKERLKKIN